MGTTVENPGDALAQRVDALGELLGLSRTRVDAAALADAGEILDRLKDRRKLSLGHTVVALAGATGSGKSTLFNALTGLELSETGVRRPTTAAPVACAWDPRGAEGLLDRLGIAPQARFARRSLLDGVHTRPGGSDTGLDGLVLLDLPDHDSAEAAHRAQVERLLELVDVLVWVVDPEKYADAALHERYLRPLSGHADVTVVVLNQVDRLPDEAADQVLDDLRRLLDEDGLAVGEHGEAGAAVLSASALTGEGVAEVRAAIGQIVAERGAADRRLAADMDRATDRLRPVCVGGAVAGLTDPAREEFAARLADSVGATAAGQRAEREWAAAAERACGVPWARLLERAPGSAEEGRESCLTPPSAARPVVAEAVRDVADAAARGLPEPWSLAVREAARRGERGLPEALQAATACPEEGDPERPGWWSAAHAAQWALMALGVAGAVALVAIGVGALRWPASVAVALLVVGTVGGPTLARACRVAGRGPARRCGQVAERRLRDAAADCGRARVLEPIAAELLRYREVREQYVVASGAVLGG